MLDMMANFFKSEKAQDKLKEKLAGTGMNNDPMARAAMARQLEGQNIQTRHGLGGYMQQQVQGMGDRLLTNLGIGGQTPAIGAMGPGPNGQPGLDAVPTGAPLAARGQTEKMSAGGSQFTGGIMSQPMPSQPLGLLQKDAAPGAAQAPQANFAAPMAAMMRPTQNNSLAMIQERLNKMIGGYYG